MANLREPYAASSLASLAWSETQEKAIDRVAASGKASGLGVLLWKAKYMLESAALAQARSMLVLLYRERYRSDLPGWADAFVGQALLEYIVTPCRACSGTGEVMRAERLVTCDECAGVALHRYSDEERARSMQLSLALTTSLQYKLRWLLDIIASEDRLVNQQLNIELERDILA